MANIYLFELYNHKDIIEEQLSVLYSDARGQSPEYVEKFIAGSLARLHARLDQVVMEISAARTRMGARPRCKF